MVSLSCRKLERISKASLGKTVSVISRSDAAASGGGLSVTDYAPIRRDFNPFTQYSRNYPALIDA
jgi:hypothetical protein